MMPLDDSNRVGDVHDYLPHDGLKPAWDFTCSGEEADRMLASHRVEYADPCRPDVRLRMNPDTGYMDAVTGGRITTDPRRVATLRRSLLKSLGTAASGPITASPAAVRTLRYAEMMAVFGRYMPRQAEHADGMEARGLRLKHPALYEACVRRIPKWANAIRFTGRLVRCLTDGEDEERLAALTERLLADDPSVDGLDAMLPHLRYAGMPSSDPERALNLLAPLWNDGLLALSFRPRAWEEDAIREPWKESPSLTVLFDTALRRGEGEGLPPVQWLYLLAVRNMMLVMLGERDAGMPHDMRSAAQTAIGRVRAALKTC